MTETISNSTGRNDLISGSQLISSRYLLHQKIGEGGMGEVYLATDRLSGEEIALKQVHIALEELSWLSQSEEDTIEDLRIALANEFQILAGLRHPHVISVLDYGFDAEQMPFYTMEYLANAQTITEAALQRDVVGKLNLVQQMLLALVYLHRRGVLHRDLKPNNILVTNGTVKVLDFGLSSFTGQNGSSGGTLLYMPPESLIYPPLPYVEASDLYAVGVMLYEFLVGHHPFKFDGDFARYVLNNDPDLTKLGVDDALTAFVGRLLAKSPTDRFANAEECLQAFAQALGQPTPEDATIRESYLQAATFVGREAELSQLQDALAAAQDGTGSAWLLGGESGVGKSRLLGELRPQALVKGFLVVQGQARADGTTFQHLWQNVLQHLLVTATHVDDLTAGVLLPLVPNIEQLLGRPVASIPDLPEQAQQQRLFSTIRTLLHNQTQPILLILEDLQWASGSLQPLATLTRDVGNASVMIIGSYRNDEAIDLPDRFPKMQQQLLSRLTAQQTAQLTVSMLGEVGNQTDLISRLQQETEGNTFFLVEMVRLLAEQAGRLDLVRQTNLPDRILPKGIQTIVEQRLERIPPEMRPLLTLAAVAGRRIDTNVLTHLNQDIPLSAWLTACDEAAIVAFQDGQWQFAHDKIREGIIANLNTDSLGQQHHQVALAIEQAYPNEVSVAGQLATHWREAGNKEQAAHYAFIAGEHAHSQNSYDEALQYLNQALALTPAEAYKKRFDSLLLQNEIYHAQLDWEAQRPILQSLSDLMDNLDITHEIIVHLHFAHYHIDKSNFPEGESHAQTMISLAQSINDQMHVAEGRMMLASVYHRMNDLDLAIDENKKGLAVVKQSENLYLQRKALLNLGDCYLRKFELEQSQACFAEALVLADDKFLAQKIYAEMGLGLVAGQQDKVALAFEHFDRGLQLAQKYGHTYEELRLLANLNWLYHTYTDDPDQARKYAEMSIEINEKAGDREFITVPIINLGILFARTGLFQAARAASQEALTILEDINAMYPFGFCSYAIGMTYCEEETYDQARHYFTLGVEKSTSPAQIALNLIERGWLYLNLGEVEHAYKDIQQIERLPKLILHSIHRLNLTTLKSAIFLAQGNTAQADTAFAATYTFLQEKCSPKRMLFPAVVWRLSRVAAALGHDDSATALATTAYSQLQTQAAKMTDEVWRQACLENVKAHRALIQFVEA